MSDAFQKNRGGIVIWKKYNNYTTIQNNIFYNNTTDEGEASSCIDFYYCGGGHVVRNNIFYGHQPLVGCSGYGCPETYMPYKLLDNIEADPMFVDSENLNFHLQNNSPAIDSGYAKGSPSYDYDGNPRPQGSGIDIGAYEYVW